MGLERSYGGSLSGRSQAFQLSKVIVDPTFSFERVGREADSVVTIVYALSAATETPLVSRTCLSLESISLLLAVALLKTGAALHNAAVGEDGRSRDVTGAVSGEEGYNGGDLFRLRHSAQRNGSVQFPKECRIRHGG